LESEKKANYGRNEDRSADEIQICYTFFEGEILESGFSRKLEDECDDDD
jgi:hypothetical protein